MLWGSKCIFLFYGRDKSKLTLKTIHSLSKEYLTVDWSTFTRMRKRLRILLTQYHFVFWNSSKAWTFRCSIIFAPFKNIRQFSNIFSSSPDSIHLTLIPFRYLDLYSRWLISTKIFNINCYTDVVFSQFWILIAYVMVIITRSNIPAAETPQFVDFYDLQKQVP